MTTITPTNLRTKRQDSAFYLSVFQPVTLLTAQVDNGSIARGARTIAYNGGSGTGFATIEGYQLFEVDTATGTQLARLKSITGNQSAGTITIDENDISFADNDVIRVKHFYPIVAVPPAIRSQVFYKFFNVTYSDQNSLVNPVAIIGPHRVGILSAGSVAFSLNSSSSYAVAQGATISSRVWSCVHNGGGITGVSFDNATAANPTLTITAADTYWLKCTVTDSNGKTQSTYRVIFVYADVKDAYKDFTVNDLSGDWNQSGWQCSIETTGAVTLSDFPDGTLICLWHVNKFDGIEGYINLWGAASQQIVCNGYLRKDQDNDNFQNGTGRISFSITTPEALMDNASEMGSISINATTTPTKWYQYASWLTIGRGVHHLLKWHSSVLETCDVLGLTDNTLGVKTCDFTEPTILQMINTLGYQRGHFAKLVSNRMGQLYFVTDSQILNTAARAALDTVFTLTTDDVSGVVDVVRSPEANVALSDLDGFSFNGTTSTPFISLIPGYRESSISYGLPGYRGGGNISTKSQVLNDQTDSNEKVGRVFAQANNNPFEIRFTTAANYLGAFDVVPSIGWYEWGISDSALKRNTSLNGKLLICRNVSHQINHQTGTIQTSVVFEPEALGPDGIQGNYPVGYPTVTGGGVARAPSWNDSNAITSGRFLATGYVSTDDDLRLVAGDVSPLTTGSINTTTGIIVNAVVVGLSPGKGVVVYKDSGNNEFRASTVNLSNNTITSLGSPITIAVAGIQVLFDARRISSTSLIATYGDYVVMMSVSGDTITVGTPVLLTYASADFRQVVGLTSTLALHSYNGLSGPAGSILTLAGLVVTEGATQFNLSTSPAGGNPNYTVALDSQTVGILYNWSGDTRASLIYNIDGPGDSLSQGDDISLLNPSNTVFDLFLSSTNRMMTLYSNNAQNNLISKIVSWDGSTGLSDGTAEILSTGTEARQRAAGVLVRSGIAAITYAYLNDAADSWKWAIKTASISGTMITDNADESILVSGGAATTAYVSITVTE